MNKLQITLMSDLCAASGKGFGSAIDTDVLYDEAGYPYIGARRLKGCLRDAALYIGTDSEIIDKLFGIKGSDESGILRLSNAVLADYEKLHKYCSGMTPEQALAQFSYVRAQTRLENGIAADGSLRFTRVVRGYSPLDKASRLIFEAECSCDGYEKIFDDICRATRNIGLMRSRGFGSVRCRLIKAQSRKAALNSFNMRKYDDKKKYRIDYTIQLKAPVILSTLCNTETVDYIPGSSVLGSMAGNYIRINKKTDSQFDKLFLSDEVSYSNLYISDKNGIVTFPAPAYLRKIKSSNGSSDGNIVGLGYKTSNSESPKVIKSGYTDDAYIPHDVNTEIISHHSRVDKGLLYAQMSICSGQYFSGNIICTGDSVSAMCGLLECGLAFGRSKGTQYALCSVVKVNVREENTPKTISGRLVYTLESDVILYDSVSDNCTCFETLCSELGVSADICDRSLSALRYNIIGGFNAKAGHRNIPVGAIEKGSVVVLNSGAAAASPEYISIGYNRNRGYGRIKVRKYDDICAINITKKAKSDKAEVISNESVLETEKIRMLAIKHFEKIEEIENIFAPGKLNAAFVGRLTLMVRQAKSYDNLIDRIKSVKSDDKRKTVLGIFDKYKGDYWYEYYSLLMRLAKYHMYGKGE